MERKTPWSRDLLLSLALSLLCVALYFIKSINLNLKACPKPFLELTLPFI